MEWHRIDERLYNPHLTNEQNIKNGCDLPPKEGMPVVVLDCDEPKTFVGDLSYDEEDKRLIWYERLHGDKYGGVRYTLWTPIEFPSKEEQGALYK